MGIVLPAQRLAYVALALITIGVGSLVHLGGGSLAADVRDVAGDALWAMMIVWWLGAITPLAGLIGRGAAAYAVCVVVEVSQRWHAPMLDAIRATRLGQLVLGSGFDARDFLAYAVGVAGAVSLDAFWRRRRRRAAIPRGG